MLNILSQEYKNNITKQLTWLIMILIIYGMILFAFPIIKDPSIKTIVDTTINTLPETLIKIVFPFGTEALSDIKMYSVSLHVGINILVSIFALGLGLYSTAKEQGEGTIEYLYINPISRGEIYFNKFIANFLNLAILIALLLGATAYIQAYIAELNFVNVLKDSINSYIIILGTGFLFLSLGTFISAMNKNTINMSLINLLIILMILIVNVIITMGILSLPSLEFVPYRSFVELVNNNIPNIGIKTAIFNIVPGLILVLLGFFIYDKKDLTI